MPPGKGYSKNQQKMIDKIKELLDSGVVASGKMITPIFVPAAHVERKKPLSKKQKAQKKQKAKRSRERFRDDTALQIKQIKDILGNAGNRAIDISAFPASMFTGYKIGKRSDRKKD